MSDSDLIEALKAIGHPLRLKILNALRGAERNVGEIEEVTEIGQPALSQQLAVLRKADLVETRKDAKLVYYRLSENQLNTIADVIDDLANRTRQSSPARRPAAPGAANFARMS